ncbi:unnamed protein product [Rotaria sp. Silwood1]|nr:unnamed protein product [Rotaria sp. Silwood1]CAF0853745.1 unnamed protein product [Rotaria sp. Silwood1]CAF0869340.1 unnamed protein product [Rotaria sp. Silwood1]CAF3362940.1 unnamed protein product [Rotaria sp. Silwood1]CAF3377060.1 unnamed protein product [Rotaria sp. Silwood1]
MNRSGVQNLINDSHDTNHYHHHMDASKKESNTMKHNCHKTNDDYSMMKMYFHTDFIETILFESWKVTSLSIFICSWIFIFILGILYEEIREIRLYLEEKQLIDRPISSNERNEPELECMNIETIESTRHIKQKIPPRYSERALHSILYAIQLILGYILMLIVMTFNVYLFLAIIFGIGTGHLLYTCNRIIPPKPKNQRRIT